MLKTKKDNKKKAKREKVEVIPVATQFNGGRVEVDYYTREGKQVPAEYVGKEIVSILSYNGKKNG